MTNRKGTLTAVSRQEGFQTERVFRRRHCAWWTRLRRSLPSLAQAFGRTQAQPVV